MTTCDAFWLEQTKRSRQPDSFVNNTGIGESNLLITKINVYSIGPKAGVPQSTGCSCFPANSEFETHPIVVLFYYLSHIITRVMYHEMISPSHSSSLLFIHLPSLRSSPPPRRTIGPAKALLRKSRSSTPGQLPIRNRADMEVSWTGGTPSHHPFSWMEFSIVNHLFWVPHHLWKPHDIVLHDHPF